MKMTGLILVLSVLGGFVYYKQVKVESKSQIIEISKPEQIEKPIEVKEVAVKPPAPPEEFQPIEVKVVRQEYIEVDPLTLPTIKKFNPPVVKEVKPVEDKKLQQSLKKIEDLDIQFTKQEKIRDSINKDIAVIKFDLAEIDKRYKERERKEKLRNNPRYRNKTIDSESLHNIDRDFNFKNKELDKAYTNLDRCEREMDKIISELEHLK